MAPLQANGRLILGLSQAGHWLKKKGASTLRAEAPRNAASVRFLAFLQDRGGVLVSGQREIGRTMGWSKSWRMKFYTALPPLVW
jgi:hypothetical protein